MKKLMMSALLLGGMASSSAFGETVFVTLEKDNALAVVDAAQGKLIKTVKIGKRPRGIVLSKDQRQLYVAASDDNTIQVIDTESLKVVGKLPSGEDPETFARDPEGRFLYVSNEDDNQVTVIQMAYNKDVKTVHV
ncbi:MAG: beta-propeller fold lactonase family protein, partial [Methylocaldum sp.]|nr:beta-propeller fold lactonase family protein [Methylocaldum sp.]